MGAKLLDIQVQVAGPDKGIPQLWALVDPDAIKEKRTFICYGTGQKIPDDPGDYIATAQDGGVLLHFFEQKS